MDNRANLQAVLRKTTETLARELAVPTGVAPDWSDHEWRVARAVAAMHGVSPLLSRRLRWRGPEAWADFLARQHRHTELRQRRVLELVTSLDARLAEAGIAALGLKGVALHAIGLYQPGERPMADVDLLVRPHDARCAAQVLESLGFIAAVAGWKEQAFTPRGPAQSMPAACYGEHAGNHVKVELHQRICERLPWRITDISDRVFPAQGRPGINPYPSKSALLLHLLFHAAGSTASQGLRLLQLHDIAALAASMLDEDWARVWQQRAGAALWWMWPPLRLVSEYFPISETVLAEARRDCPRALTRAYRHRTLSDVSYSYLSIDAFPGIEWAPSIAQKMRYVANRLSPGAAQLAVRRQTSTTEAWAANAAWPTMSQGRRVLSWILNRPGRPVTLYSVNAAMAEPS